MKRGSDRRHGRGSSGSPSSYLSSQFQSYAARYGKRGWFSRPALPGTNLDFYIAFGFWKVACIVEGVYARYLEGALGQRDPASLSGFVSQVDTAAHNAAEHAGRL